MDCNGESLSLFHLVFPVALWLKFLSVQESGSGIPRKVDSIQKTSGLKRVVGRPPVPSFSCTFYPF